MMIGLELVGDSCKLACEGAKLITLMTKDIEGGCPLLVQAGKAAVTCFVGVGAVTAVTHALNDVGTI
jgi:hypothetical protein